MARAHNAVGLIGKFCGMYRGSLVQQPQQGVRVRQILEVRQVVEVYYGILGKEGSRVIRALYRGIEEYMVYGIEGLEIIKGGDITLKLVSRAVDSCYQLGKVEYIQGTVISQSLYSQDSAITQGIITLELTD